MPVTEYTEYYVDLLEGKGSTRSKGVDSKRRKFPKIKDLLEWGVFIRGMY
jgi:hypothetical protein